MSPRLRRFLRRVLAVLVAAPLIGEAGLRLGGLRFRFPSPCALIDGRGCILLPNLRETIAVGEDSFVYTTDSRGLRSREPTDADAARRHVVVLGDSVAFGAFVGDGEVFTALLDAELAPRGIAVINAASIYLKGTEQQLRFLLDEEDRLRPDRVILVFTSQNDFSDNSREEFFREGVPQPWRPRLLQRVVKAAEHVPGYGFLTDHSWLFGLASFTFLNAQTRWDVSYPPADRRVPATASAIDLLAAECRRRGAPFSVVLIPHQRDLGGRLRDGHYPEGSVEALLLDIVARLGVPVLDGGDILSAPGAMRRDGHLSTAGHRALADALAPRLLEELAP
jgi:lysophospholipase L1-like esterase